MLLPTPSAAPRNLGADQKLALRDKVAALMRSARPVPFSMEGPCRRAIRTRLCDLGWGWERADLIAKEIVEAALRLVGAKRPSWDEGQPEAPDGYLERTRCVQCGWELPEDRPPQQRFCDSRCKANWHQRIWLVRQAEEGTAYDLVVGSLKTNRGRNGEGRRTATDGLRA